MLKKTTLAMLTLALVTAGAAQAQDQDPVKWSAETEAMRVAPGGTFTVVVKAEIDFGWHIYSMTQGKGGPVPTKITLAEDQPFVLAAPVMSAKPVVKFDENFWMEVESHEIEASFRVPVKVAAEPDGKVNAVKVRARYQVCNQTVCLPAQTVDMEVAVRVVEG